MSKEEKLPQSEPTKGVGWFFSMVLWAFKIVLAPLLIPVWYLPLGLYRLTRYGVRKFIWDDFLSFIVGSVIRNPQTRRVESIRFCTYGDMVHFHYAIWGSVICAILAWWKPEWRDELAPFLVLLPIWCLIVVKWEFPFDKIWKPALALFVLVPLADFGIYKGTEWLTSVVFPWLEANASWLGITSGMAGGYEAVWLWRKVFHLFAFEASAGTHLFAAVGWGLFFIVSVGEAWVYNRYEIDEKDLYRLQFFKGESREPVYMRGIRIVIKDVLETMPFGFASLVIRINGRDRVLRNVPGLAFQAWLRGAMDALINASPNQGMESAPAPRKKGETEEDLAVSFKEMRGGDSMDVEKAREVDHLGDHDIKNAEVSNEADDVAGIQEDLDSEDRKL
jgi:hypothetical protein